MIFAGRFTEAEAFADAHVMATPIKQMSYQALGDFKLSFPGVGTPERYHRELDLDSATATTRFISNGITHVREAIAAPGDRVIAVRVTVSEGGTLGMDVALTSPQTSATTRAEGNALLMTGANTAEQGIPAALRFAACVLVKPEGGRLTAEGDRPVLRGVRAVTILVAMATSYRSRDDVSGDPQALTAAAIAGARRRPFARIAVGRAVLLTPRDFAGVSA